MNLAAASSPVAAPMPPVATGPDPSLDEWAERFRASRTARDQQTDAWARNARLWAMAREAGPMSQTAWDGIGETAIDETTGRRDRVSLGLVHRNAEQTMAVLDVPEVNLSATMVEYQREMDSTDEAAENVVAAAVAQSLRDSGLMAGPRVSELVKQTALICGHGVTYTHWAVHKAKVHMGLGPTYRRGTPGPDGLTPLELVLDELGNPIMAPMMDEQVLHEGCHSVFVSPLDFLFDPQAPSIALSGWHACEQIVRLADLEADGRFQLPEGLAEQTHQRVNLFGEEPGTEEVVTKGVAVITAFDRQTRQLCVFLEAGSQDSLELDPITATNRQGAELHCLLSEITPVRFDRPDDSPFTAFVPIPLIDWPWGISQIGTVRVAAELADKLSSRQATQTLGQKRIFVFDKNSGLSEEQIRTAMNSPDFSIVGLDNGFGVDLSKVMTELPMQHTTKEAYTGVQEGKDAVAGTSGVTDVPYGGASTATESENLMSVGSARIKRKIGIYMAWLEEVAAVHHAFLAAFAPDGQSVMVPGLWGQPERMVYGREAFRAGRFRFKAIPGGSAAADTPVQAKAKADFAAMVAPHAGPAMKLYLLEMMAVSLGLQDQARMRRAAFQDTQAAAAQAQMAMGGMPPGGPQNGPQGVDGRLRQAGPSLQSRPHPQLLRAAINQLNES